MALRDDRVRAAIAISAPPFYGEAQPRKILETVTVPSLHVTCTEDIIRIPGYYSGADDRVAVFDATGSERKWRALGKADPKRKLPVLNFGGQSAELWCEGGEARFVTQLIAESAHFAHKVLWFSTLVSKASNLPAIEIALKKAGVLESQVVEMSQGQKQSRFVAWTFQTKNEQQIWRQRWVR